MTEEQRYRERIQLEKDKIQLLKRIAEALDVIAAPCMEKKYNRSGDDDVEQAEKTIKRCKYEDFVSALDEDWEKTGDYSDFKSNGEWHGEYIDPSDPSRK